MRIAVVGLNSLFRSGASSFMLHLTQDSDWDAISLNVNGLVQTNDMSLDGLHKNFTHKYLCEDDARELEEYDIVIFAASKWGGNYSYLRNLRLKRVGIVVHDHLDFTRMGMQELMDIFPAAITFCMYEAVRKRLQSPVMIKHPFARNLLPGGKSSVKDKFICTARFSPSKHPEIAVDMVNGQYPLHFYGVGSNNSSEMMIIHMILSKHINVHLHSGAYTFVQIANAYNSAMGLLDATILDGEKYGVQYTTLEAWHYGVVPLVHKSFFSDEVIDGCTCLELTNENVKRVWEDERLRDELGSIGRSYLELHKPEIIRDCMLEYLL